LGKDLGRNLVAHSLQQLEFAVRGQAAGCEVGAFEIAGDALILTVENLPVHFLEIKRVVEGKSHPWIPKFVATSVEGKSLHHSNIVDGEFLEEDALVGNCWEIVGSGPVLRAVLDAPVDCVSLERLKSRGAVAKILEP